MSTLPFYSTLFTPIITISLHLLMTNMPLVNLFLAKQRSVGCLQFIFLYQLSLNSKYYLWLR